MSDGAFELSHVLPATEQGSDEPLHYGQKDEVLLKRLVERHAELTGSPTAREMLADWPAALGRFTKVFPTRIQACSCEPQEGGELKWDSMEAFSNSPVWNRAMNLLRERIKHFNEFIAIYSDTEGREQASRCMDCGIPFCQHQCPLHNTMPDTQRYVSDGDWESAAVLDSTNSFPEITGRICPAPCEEGCTLGLHRDAVSIKAIEKKIAEVAFSRGYVTPQPAAASTGCCVAMVSWPSRPGRGTAACSGWGMRLPFTKDG